MREWEFPVTMQTAEARIPFFLSLGIGHSPSSCLLAHAQRDEALNPDKEKCQITFMRYNKGMVSISFAKLSSG